MAKIDFLMKWPPWPSTSANNRDGQTGWGLHQRGWLNDAYTTPQRRPCRELAWIWTNFLWTASGDGFDRDSRRGGKSGRKTMLAKKIVHRCIGAHARVHMHFLRRVFDRCCEQHACVCVYVGQVLCASAYTFAYTLDTACAYALMYVQFVHLALGNKDGGG